MVRKSRQIRLVESLFGGVLGFVLVLLLGAVIRENMWTLSSGTIAGISVIGIGTLMVRAWRR
ncbi:MAG: hypothetical protein ABSD41_04905 [Candidatus Bathyarchaeia archaeon]